ncbi:MAG: alpha/beta hydrolase [Myxococcota bacterium]
MPWVYLAASLVGALFTYNAWRPVLRSEKLLAPSFMAGWLTSELPLHHIAWQAFATILFAATGALGAAPGWLGLGISLVSWWALLQLVPVARAAEGVFEASLQGGLGPDFEAKLLADSPVRSRPMPRVEFRANPFRFRSPDVTVRRDIGYVPNAGVRNRLDVYAPKERVEGAPVLLQIHGGGWIMGNKREQALPLMNHLAERGWICVAANYRLSPSASFPEHLVDCKRALAWIRSEIESFGGDPDFVVVTGGSAGGHLSAMMGLTAGDPEYQPGFENVDTRVAAAVPFYGVYDWSNANGLQNSAGMRNFIGTKILKKSFDSDPDAFRRASPLHRIHADAPPFYVIHGASDSLCAVEEARLFVEKLRETSKEPVAYAEVPGAQHAFDVFHSLRTDYAVQAVDRFTSWVHSRYRSQKA